MNGFRIRDIDVYLVSFSSCSFLGNLFPYKNGYSEHGH